MNATSLRDALCQHIDNQRGELVNLCTEVIRIPTENPPGDTRELAKMLATYIEARGLSVVVQEPKPGIVNMLTSFGQGSPHLVLLAHMDTYPAGAGWTFPPFGGEVRDDRILGRGACDMKGGLSAVLFTFLLLAEEGRHLPGTLSLCLVSEGESGGQWGTKWILENTALRTANAVIMAEPGGLDVVAIGEKGSFWLKLRLRGKSAHAAYDTLGESAILKMIRAIPAVTALRQIHPDPPADLAEIIRLERPFIESAYGPGIGEVLTRVSATVSRIRGGSAINLVPEECEIDFDLRLPVGVPSTLVRAKLEEELAKTGVTEYEMETLVCSEATYTSPEDRIVHAVSRNVERITSQPVRHLIKIGATDTRFLRHAGIPAVCHGPGFHNMGAPDEFVTIEELVTVAKVHGCSVIDYILGE